MEFRDPLHDQIFLDTVNFPSHLRHRLHIVVDGVDGDGGNVVIHHRHPRPRHHHHLEKKKKKLIPSQTRTKT